MATKIARVYLKGQIDRWIDFPIPTDGTLGQFIAAIRIQGFVGPDGGAQAYIPLDEIKMILQMETGNNVTFLHTVQ
jgi:hypothetical protein